MARAYAGITAPIAFFALLLVSGLMRPGHDSVRDTISELTVGPGGAIQRVNFWAYGFVLALVIMPAIRRSLPRSAAATSVSVALVTIALGCVGVASFPPDSSPLGSMPWPGWLHLVSAMVLVFATIPIACFSFARAVRGEPKWRPLRAVSLLVSVTCAVLLIATVTALVQEVPEVTARVGLMERCYVFLFLGWQCMVSWKLAVVAGRESS